MYHFNDLNFRLLTTDGLQFFFDGNLIHFIVAYDFYDFKLWEYICAACKHNEIIKKVISGIHHLQE
jgi:hypothetical protein